MQTLPTTVEELLDWWPGNIPFKGGLISDDGCMCAQGQVLHLLGGMSPDDLRNTGQAEADKRTAELLGISRAHAVLLSNVNDSQPGAPTCVIREPEKVLGDHAQIVLAFWRHLDRMTADDWVKVAAAWAAAWVAAGDAAGDWDAAGHAAWVAALVDARAAARAAAWAAAGDWDAARAAARASNEIQGAAIMRAKGQAFFFLPMFGFANPEAVIAADGEAA
jgi:hypothetical protein